MPCASGSDDDQFTVLVWRRMYAFHASEPDSRPPPVSFSPPLEAAELAPWASRHRRRWKMLVNPPKEAMLRRRVEANALG